MKTFDQYMAETGRQSELDALGKNNQTDQARKIYDTTGSFTGLNTPVNAGGSNPLASLSQPQTQPTLNIQGTYDNLYTNDPEVKANNERIKALDDQITAISQAQNKALAINEDNPWYNEALLTGKNAMVRNQYNRDISTITQQKQLLADQIAKKQADAQAKITLATQQYQLNRQEFQDNLNNFNALLEIGALDNATGQDIANITLSTGLNSSMIENAIEQRKKNNQNLTVKEWTDGQNDYFIAVDNQGNIVNRQVIGQTKGSGGSLYSDDEVVSKFLQMFNQETNDTISNLWDDKPLQQPVTSGGGSW